MRKKIGKIALAALAVVGLLAAPAAAQEWRGGRGRLEGVVTDMKGNPIAGAKVALRWQGQENEGPDLKTNTKGEWAILGLTGGPWDVDVEAPGYQTRKISIQVSEISRNPEVKIELAPEVKQEAPHEEIRVGGKEVSKDVGVAIDQANQAWTKADEAKDAVASCQGEACEAAKKQYEAMLREALSDYEKALPAVPDFQPILSRLEIGNYWLKDYDRALKYARKITDLDPGNATSWLMIAELELQKGDFEAGKAALANVPDEKITDPQPYMNMGILYYNKGNSAEAENYFTKALGKDAADPDAYFYRGLARYQEKQMAQARADFEKYLELDPQGDNAQTVKEILGSMKPRPKK